MPFRQLGQYEDEETGLYYNRFRYYDCNTGTYISKDPIGLLGGLNVYAYVWDSNTLVDILGLAPNISVKLQSYVFRDARIKGIHANVYIDGIKKTEALLDISENGDLYWKRFGDLNVSKKENKAIDKIISGLTKDENLMSQASSQLDLLIKDLNKDAIYGSKGDMDIAKRNIKKYTKMREKLCI